MSDSQALDVYGVDEVLRALGDQLAAGEQQFTIAVVGGSAVPILGLVSRVTRDVDVVALVDGQTLLSAEPLPAALSDAARVLAHLGVDHGPLGA